MSTPAFEARPTLCKTCDNVVEQSKSRHPSRWQCRMFPRTEGFGFVTDDTWDKFDPWMYCNDINGGACPLWKERKNHEPE